MVALISGDAGTVAAAALTVQAAEAVEMSEELPAGTAGVAVVVAAGSVEVVEVEAVGSVEAFGHQLLCAKAGGAVQSQVSAEGYAVPAPFSGAGLL